MTREEEYFVAKAVILHTIDDVKHCLKHKLHKDAKLFSANVNVVYYLRYYCKIECFNICSLLKDSEILSIQKTTYQICGDVLDKLDEHISPNLNLQMNLSLHYFQSLYSFIGALQLCLYFMLQTCLREILQKSSWDNILMYEAELGPFNNSISSFMSQTFPHIECNFVHPSYATEARSTVIDRMHLDEVGELARNYDGEMLRSSIFEQRGKNNKNVFVFEPIQNSNFCSKLNEATIYNINLGKWKFNQITLNLDDNSFPHIDILKDVCLNSVTLVDLLYQDIKKDFCKKIFQYLQIVNGYQGFVKLNPAHTVIWEEPPLQGAGALLLEFFLKNKATKVFGVQPESTFWLGKWYNPYALELFKRCDTYFPLENIKEELLVLYPDAVCKTSVIPIKNVSEEMSVIEGPRPRKQVDLVIYLYSTFSVLRAGYIISDVRRQETLLDLLEKYENKTIHVVAQDAPSFENCAMLSFIMTLKNVTLIKEEDYLVNYLPNMIVMEFPLPVLNNILQENIPLILIKNELVNLSNSYLARLLEKQVYYVDGLEEAAHLLQMHFTGKLKE